MYKCLKLIWHFPSQSCSEEKFYCFQRSAIKDQTSKSDFYCLKIKNISEGLRLAGISETPEPKIGLKVR